MKTIEFELIFINMNYEKVVARWHEYRLTGDQINRNLLALSKTFIKYKYNIFLLNKVILTSLIIILS